jgi:hypothetical protein
LLGIRLGDVFEFDRPHRYEATSRSRKNLIQLSTTEIAAVINLIQSAPVGDQAPRLTIA